MVLSEELNRLDSQMDATIKAISKNYVDVFKNDEADGFQDKKGALRQQLLVGGKNPDDFIKAFEWDQRKLSKSGKVRELASAIAQKHSQAEVELKKKASKYTDLRNSLKTIERKEQGSLLVRPLSQYVVKEDIVETDMFTSLMIIVPSIREQEFKDMYESMEEQNASRHHDSEAKQAEKTSEPVGVDAKSEEAAAGSKVEPCFNVVPASAKRLFPKNDSELLTEEFCLFRIFIMRKGLNSIKAVCRDQRFTVREFAYDAQAVSKDTEEKQTLRPQTLEASSGLKRWCEAWFAEVFQHFMYLKAIRTLVETVLRFGLPVNMSASIIHITDLRNIQKLRDILASLYQNLDTGGLTAQLDNNDMDISGFGADFYPYVYLTIQN